MPRSNLEIISVGYERFGRLGEFDPHVYAPEFVWDMSNYPGWPERQEYPGLEGAREFMTTWREGWKDWALEIHSIHEAPGGEVVAIATQRGTSVANGIEAEMDIAQVWTLRDGLVVRMAMHGDWAAALESVGLPGDLADPPGQS